MSTKKADLLVKALVLGLFLSIAACGGRRDWYNYANPGAVFEQDLKVCKNRSESIASGHSLLGNGIVLNAYNANLLECLYSRGWTHVSPESLNDLQKFFSNRVRFDRHENEMIAFTERIGLEPHKFSLLHTNSSVYGPGYIKKFNFRSQNKTYLNFIVQKNLNKEFENTAFKVDNAFVQYSSGAENLGSKHLNWAVYFGKFEGQWVMGLGAYVLLSPVKRITIVISRDMVEPGKDPAYPLRLTEEQYLGVRDFKEKWLHWIRQSLGGNKACDGYQFLNMKDVFM